MLAKRIIPRLDVTEGRLTRAPGNEELVENDAVELSRFYDAAGADELLLFDRGMTSDRTARLEGLIEQVTRAVFVPLIVGGGVNSTAQIRSLLRAGADRVLVQSHALRDPRFLRAAVERFGPERIILSIEVMRRRSAVAAARVGAYSGSGSGLSGGPAAAAAEQTGGVSEDEFLVVIGNG